MGSRLQQAFLRDLFLVAALQSKLSRAHHVSMGSTLDLKPGSGLGCLGLGWSRVSGSVRTLDLKPATRHIYSAEWGFVCRVLKES